MEKKCDRCIWFNGKNCSKKVIFNEDCEFELVRLPEGLSELYES